MRHIYAYSGLFLFFSFVLLPAVGWGQGSAIKGTAKGLIQTTTRQEALLLRSLASPLNDAALARFNQTYVRNLVKSDVALLPLSKATGQDLERILSNNLIIQNQSFQRLLRAREDMRVSARPDFNSVLQSLPFIQTRMGNLIILAEAGPQDLPDMAKFLVELKNEYKSNIYIVSYGAEGSVALPKETVNILARSAPVYNMVFVPGRYQSPLLRSTGKMPISMQDFSQKEGFCQVALLSGRGAEEEDILALKKFLSVSDPSNIVVVAGRGLSYDASRPNKIATAMLDYEPTAGVSVRAFRFDKVSMLTDKKVLWNQFGKLEPSIINLFQKGPDQHIVQQVGSHTAEEILGNSMRIISH